MCVSIECGAVDRPDGAVDIISIVALSPSDSGKPYNWQKTVRSAFRGKGMVSV